MRVKEELNKQGYFWLQSSNKEIPGTLTIKDGGIIELETVGLFDNNINNLELGIINGYIEDKGFVTLVKCHYIRKKFANISKALIHADRAFIGVCYEKCENIIFNEFMFSIEGIDEWVGLSGIRVDCDYNKSKVSVLYSPVEDISFKLDNGMKLIITHTEMLPKIPYSKEVSIKQKTYFKLTSEKECLLNDFIFIAFKITTFLGFAINKTVCIDYVSSTAKHNSQNIGKSKAKKNSILIYYRSIPFVNKSTIFNNNIVLFRFTQIREQFEKIINNWINAYDSIGIVLNLYFSTKNESNRYVERKFLTLVQSLEAYSRRISDEKLMSEHDFKVLTENLIDKCPKENKDWLQSRLAHGNEINLRKRVKKLIEPYKKYFGNNKKRNSLVRDIVETRNYLTHYDESFEQKKLSNNELLILCLKIEIIFQFNILSFLGFNDTQIDCYYKNSKLYKNLTLYENNI